MKNRRLVLVLALAACVVVALVVRLRRAPSAAPGTASSAASGAAAPSSDTPWGIGSAAMASAAVRPSAIAGRVTDEKGAAVAGASVCAFASGHGLVTTDTQHPFCAQTRTDGHYRLEGLPPARYDVHASATSYLPARADDRAIALKAAEVREHVDLVLQHGGVEVKGHVEDVAGGPVGGATVTLSFGEEWAPSAKVVTTSSADGAFTAWGPAGRVTATATASGYTAGSKAGVAPGQSLEIVLTPESVLQGKVVEAGTDAPVAFARVTAGMLRAGPVFGVEDASTMTDAEGRFRFAALEPGRYKPSATSAHGWGEAPESVLLGLAETSRDVVIELHAAFSVSGRIDLAGRPCARGGVTLAEKATAEERRGDADPDGRVRIDGVMPGTYTPRVHCEDATSQDRYDTIVVSTADVSGVVWKVDAGFTLAGVVVDAKGAPVPRARVQGNARGKDPRARFGWATGETSPDGAFHLRGLHATSYELTVHGDGVPPLDAPVIVNVDRDLEGVKIVLAAGGTIEGTIEDGAGARVGGLDVMARGDRWDMGRGMTTSRDDGTFAFASLRPGAYHVEAHRHWNAVRAPGTKDDDVQGVTTTVRAGETARVKLVVESHRGEIRGRVVDSGGVPLSDAFVDAEREVESAGATSGSARRAMQWSWDARSPVLTDTDGHFVVKKLSPGAYTVRAFRKGGGETAVEGVRTGSAVTLTIRSEGSIGGTLGDVGGRVPDRFTIAIRDEHTGISRQETFFRTRGAWTMRDLPEGNYHVVGSAEGRAAAQVSLRQGERREGVQLLLEPRATVRGSVVALESGAPVPGLIVLVRAAVASEEGAIILGTDGDRRYITDENGRFEVDQAPSGRVVLDLIPRDFQDSPFSIAEVAATVEPGRVTELRPIRIGPARVKGALTGDLGFVTKPREPGRDLDATRHEVVMVRPSGPAAKAGMAAGDEIVTVDGYDVVGPNGHLYDALTRVPAGTVLELGLKSGKAVTLQAGPPGRR